MSQSVTDVPFRLLRLDSVQQSVIESFNLLPLDPYLRGNHIFRRRRYSRASVSIDSIRWLDCQPFHQSLDLNEYAGGLSRRFEGIDEPVRQFLADYPIPIIVAELPGADFEVGVHQIRITSDDDHMGKPAPEGIHRDGFDFVAIALMDRRNTNGGITLLVEPDRLDDVLFEETLRPGEILLFDDRLVAHYTTPITPRYPGQASRDVFVLTFSTPAGRSFLSNATRTRR